MSDPAAPATRARTYTLIALVSLAIGAGGAVLTLRWFGARQPEMTAVPAAHFARSCSLLGCIGRKSPVDAPADHRPAGRPVGSPVTVHALVAGGRPVALPVRPTRPRDFDGPRRGLRNRSGNTLDGVTAGSGRADVARATKVRVSDGSERNVSRARDPAVIGALR